MGGGKGRVPASYGLAPKPLGAAASSGDGLPRLRLPGHISVYGRGRPPQAAGTPLGVFPALGRPRRAVRRPVGCPPRRDSPAGHVTRKPAQAVPPQAWRRLPGSWPGLRCPKNPPPRAASGPAPPTPDLQRLPQTAPALEGGRHRAVSPFLGWVTRKPTAGPLRRALLTNPGALPGRWTRPGGLWCAPRISEQFFCTGPGKNQLTARPASPGRGPGPAARTLRLAGARRPCG